jgi:hypothetical protein
MYGYKIVVINLDNYLLSDLKNKFRDQEIEISLYLPEGTLFKPIQAYRTDGPMTIFFNLHYSSDKYLYKLMDNKVKCHKTAQP